MEADTMEWFLKEYFVPVCDQNPTLSVKLKARSFLSFLIVQFNINP